MNGNFNVHPQVLSLINESLIPKLKDFGEVYYKDICKHVTGEHVNYTINITDERHGFRGNLLYMYWTWFRKSRSKYVSKIDEMVSTDEMGGIPEIGPAIEIQIFYKTSDDMIKEPIDGSRVWAGKVNITYVNDHKYFFRLFNVNETNTVEQCINSFYYEAIAFIQFHKQEIIGSLNKEYGSMKEYL